MFSLIERQRNDRRSTNSLQRILLTLTAAGFTLFAVAEEQPQGSAAERGKEKSVACVACHGAEGTSTNPMFPDLAGQNATYLEIQLSNFKSGERVHPMMSPVAESLDEEDIKDLSVYYSSLPPSEDPPAGD